MKPKLLVLFTVLTCVLPACDTSQQPVTPDLLVGTYSYVSEDPRDRTTDHNLNRLVLQSGGKYDLVEGGTTKATSEKKGIWKLSWGDQDRPVVDLDHAGYPVEITRTEIRLLVDLDTGVWWFKTRSTN